MDICIKIIYLKDSSHKKIYLRFYVRRATNEHFRPQHPSDQQFGKATRFWDDGFYPSPTVSQDLVQLCYVLCAKVEFSRLGNHLVCGLVAYLEHQIAERFLPPRLKLFLHLVEKIYCGVFGCSEYLISLLLCCSSDLVRI